MEIDPGFEQQVIRLIGAGVSGKFKKVKITGGTSLQAELGLDSIGMLALVFQFEELFGIDIAQLGVDINVAKLRTVTDLINAGREILIKAQSEKVS